jgi:hypothetical protein
MSMDRPETIDELRDALIAFEKHKEDFESGITHIKPCGPVLTPSAMLELVDIGIEMRGYKYD